MLLSTTSNGRIFLKQTARRKKLSPSADELQMSMVSKSISKVFPGFSSVYHLTSTGSDRPFHASLTDGRFEITRAEIIPPEPVSARWHSGSKKPGDVIWTTFAGPLLLSERVVMILGESGFTGWRTYDVKLLNHDGMTVPGY